MSCRKACQPVAMESLFSLSPMMELLLVPSKLSRSQFPKVGHRPAMICVLSEIAAPVCHEEVFYCFLMIELLCLSSNFQITKCLTGTNMICASPKIKLVHQLWRSSFLLSFSIIRKVTPLSQCSRLVLRSGYPGRVCSSSSYNRSLERAY